MSDTTQPTTNELMTPEARPLLTEIQEQQWRKQHPELYAAIVSFSNGYMFQRLVLPNQTREDIFEALQSSLPARSSPCVHISLPPAHEFRRD